MTGTTAEHRDIEAYRALKETGGKRSGGGRSGPPDRGAFAGDADAGEFCLPHEPDDGTHDGALRRQ